MQLHKPVKLFVYMLYIIFTIYENTCVQISNDPELQLDSLYIVSVYSQQNNVRSFRLNSNFYKL